MAKHRGAPKHGPIIEYPEGLIDAVQRHEESPDTFDRPDQAALEGVRPGWFIKIGVEFNPDRKISDMGPPPIQTLAAARFGAAFIANAPGERFWVEVTEVVPDGARVRATDESGTLVEAPAFVGKVSNTLVFTDRHGLRAGDLVKFDWCHALDVTRDA